MKITLKAARINVGLTQTDVSIVTGFARSTLTRWENGQTVPKKEDLQRLCELYRVSPADIRV